MELLVVVQPESDTRPQLAREVLVEESIHGTYGLRHGIVMRRISIARHHLGRMRLARSIHGLHGSLIHRLWRLLLLVLPVELRCSDLIILRPCSRPGRLLGPAPSNELRARLKALVVISSLLVDLSFSTVDSILGGNRAGTRDTITVLAICTVVSRRSYGARQANAPWF